MIGKLAIALTPFYNKETGRHGFKGRPVLIVAKADSEDYVVLPVSRVKAKSYIDKVYDIKITPEQYPELHLAEKSYIRTHKQAIVNASDIDYVRHPPIDLKEMYPDLYIEVLDKRNQFSQCIDKQALN